jgi:hypothetical protein
MKQDSTSSAYDACLTAYPVYRSTLYNAQAALPAVPSGKINVVHQTSTFGITSSILQFDRSAGLQLHSLLWRMSFGTTVVQSVACS